MIHSRKFVVAAILLGLALVIAGLLAVPFNGSARAAPGQSDPAAAERIGAAFASVANPAPAVALSGAASRLSKGNLHASTECAGAVWPNIDAACLSRGDGSPATRVRTITVGYQAGTATFSGQIQTPGSFIRSGDSGSLMVTETGNNPVGLCFAGSSQASFAPETAVAVRAFYGA